MHLQASAAGRGGESRVLQDRMLRVCHGKAMAALKESRANFGCFRESKVDQGAALEAPQASAQSTASQKSPNSIRSFSSMRG